MEYSKQGTEVVQLWVRFTNKNVWKQSLLLPTVKPGAKKIDLDDDNYKWPSFGGPIVFDIFDRKYIIDG